MAEIRIGRGWTGQELQERLHDLRTLEASFRGEPHTVPRRPGWRSERSVAVIAREPPGPPVEDGAFARASQGVADYEFSDPSIVAGYFDRSSPLLGRRMLLEIKVMGVRCLCGTVVGATEDRSGPDFSTFGYRYDTLEGHLETGSEWFIVRKDHRTGEIRLHIRSRWGEGRLDQLWLRAGFRTLAPWYRRLWLHRAHERLAALVAWPRAELPAGRGVPPGGLSTGALPASPDRGFEETDETVAMAAGLGALTGIRSMSGPAALTYRAATTGPQPGAGRLERALAHPETAVATTTLAGAEMLADKSKRIPARTDPIPLLGRAVIGALVGAGVAARWRERALAPAVAGAATAVTTAAAAQMLRTRGDEQLSQGARRKRSVLRGLVEDAVVLLGARAWQLAAASTERDAYAVVERRRRKITHHGVKELELVWPRETDAERPSVRRR